jgi:cytoskeleton protein RodZ
LNLQITQRCWVSVTSDGNRVLVKLLEPGDAQTFDALESLYLILGNAGGVRASINGKPAKPFGKDGEVVRVSINVQNVNELLEQPKSP